MKPREKRLQAILERIRDTGPAGADYREIGNWASWEFGVAIVTAAGYIRDLTGRGAVAYRFGRLTATGRDTRGRL